MRFLLCLLSVVALQASDADDDEGKGITVEPDNQHVTYIGRFDFKDPKHPAFSWSATQIALTFNGSSTLRASFTPPGPGMRMLAIVDDVPGETFMVGADKNDDDDDGKHGKSAETVTLASGLALGSTHTVVVWKLSEDTADSDKRKKAIGTAIFNGFELESTAIALPAPPRRSRRLEFIGDSDTAGWCADGDPHGDYDTAHKYENAHETWAAQLARSLNAEMMVEAISGWGVGAGASAIQQNLPNSVNFDDNSTPWDYTKWVPDAVVMLIGPNDESYNMQKLTLNTTVTGEKFIEQYTNLLDYVSHAYAKADPLPQIISVCGGSLNGLDPCKDIQTAQEAFNKKQGKSGFKAGYVTITKEHWNEINGPNGKGKSEYNGCDGHYDRKGHAVLMGDILPGVKALLAW